MATPHLGLEIIASSETQKHVRVNGNSYKLDVLVQACALDRNLSAPPVSPTLGDTYIVGGSATGAWSGHTDHLAVWLGSGWDFTAPVTGVRAYIEDESALLVYDSGWQEISPSVTELQNLTLLGIGTTADATNPFSAKLNKALWTAKTAAEGGDGDLRYTLNKETASDVLSLLMQRGFSGRAEIGLIGDDDLTFKVSPDGSVWNTALVLDKDDGTAVFKVASSTVASAATANIGAATTMQVDISGTTTITSFGSVANSLRFVRFTGALTLTHNATTLILPGGASITTAAGDTALVTSDASGNWRVRHYQRASGKPVVGPASTDITDSTSTGRSVLTAASATAARNAIASRWGLLAPETRTLIDAFSTEPRRKRSFELDDLICALIDAGVWTKLDALYVINADAQSSLINIKNPGTYNLTAVGSPTFTADRGWTGDGVSAHLTTGFVPSTAGGLYTLNAAHAGYWRRSNNTDPGNNADLGTTGTELSLRMISRSTTDQAAYRINDTTSVVLSTVTNGAGHHLANRSASNAKEIYRAGANVSTTATLSTSLPPTQIAILRLNNLYTTAQISAAHFGGSLSSGEVSSIYTSISTYLTAIGA